MQQNLQIKSQQSYAAGFSALASSPIDEFNLNLSAANLVEVIQQHEKAKRRTSPKYSHSSIESLIKEIGELSKATIMPIHINGLFYDYLYGYLVDVKGLQTSTVKNYFDQISSCLDWAAKYGCPINPGFRDYTVKVNEREKYALTFEEICMIRDFDFSTLKRKVRQKIRVKKTVIVDCTRNCKTYRRKINKWEITETTIEVPKFSRQHTQVLERVRDMFVLSCCMFQRYSDMKTLCPDNFSEDRNVYRVTQQKTGSKATVVINDISVSKDIAREILEKYNYHAPYNRSVNTYNRHLHELLEAIGSRFDDDFVVEEKIMGEIHKTIRKLSKCITSHTARRTAITLSTKTNNEFKIRKASGHRDGRSFARYVILD